MRKPAEGRRRVMIEDVRPHVDCGRHPVKRALHDVVRVTASVFADGHDMVSARLLYRAEGDRAWKDVRMLHDGNDVWSASFQAESIGRYRYCVEGWVDDFASWRHDYVIRMAAGQDLGLALRSGGLLVKAAVSRARKADAARLRQYALQLRDQVELDISAMEEVGRLMDRYPDLRFATRSERELEIVVDRERAVFSSWYEMFPRSCAPVEGMHGTFRDCEALLPQIAAMGFDVLYLPPIHPIGASFRKGRNNFIEAASGDVGSPWAIGSSDGGHKSIHPQLGTLKDFQRLLAKAEDAGLEVALDIALQCSPDHPYVSEHAEWFRKRPDGSIQYAENPPKKYQDIYPLDFTTAAWRGLWDEVLSVFVYWIKQGVRIFRVDNPHTKAFPFWEWVIEEIKSKHPDVLFLAEAFTRPHVMYSLAKSGFSQSYTYFTWRNTKEELTEYLKELTQTEVNEFFRPNFWPNTPDILPGILQEGGSPAFVLRLILAATLSANYGIYGPVYELAVNVPQKPGGEEYLNSEKYELKHWHRDAPSSLAPLVTRLNQIRRGNKALQRNMGLHFHGINNDALICYSKASPDGSNVVLVVVNLSTVNTESGWTELDMEDLGLAAGERFRVIDMLDGNEYAWAGQWNYVQLTPEVRPAHIFLIERVTEGSSSVDEGSHVTDHAHAEGISQERS